MTKSPKVTILYETDFKARMRAIAAEQGIDSKAFDAHWKSYHIIDRIGQQVAGERKEQIT